MARGLLYWLQMPTLSLPLRTERFDFRASVGTPLNTLLAPLSVAAIVMAQLSLVSGAWLQWRYFRRRWRFWRLTAPGPDRPRSWLRAYVLMFSSAVLICIAISPTTIMFWQAFIALPASALALVMTVDALLRTRLQGTAVKVLQVACVLAIALMLAQTFGAPMYRCGGDHVATYDEMLLDLHAPRACIAERPLALRRLPDQ
jgi:hypothetical protein